MVDRAIPAYAQAAMSTLDLVEQSMPLTGEVADARLSYAGTTKGVATALRLELEGATMAAAGGDGLFEASGTTYVPAGARGYVVTDDKTGESSIWLDDGLRTFCP